MRTTVTKTFTKRTTFQKGSTSYYKLGINHKDKGKEKLLDPSKDKTYPVKSTQLDKKCFKCHNYGYFQVTVLIEG